MPLPLTVSCFSKIQTGFTFLVPAHPGSPDRGPLNGSMCVTWYQICTRVQRWICDSELCVCMCQYDSRFADAFWNSSRQSLLRHLLNIMTSWALVVDVWYLPPRQRQVHHSLTHLLTSLLIYLLPSVLWHSWFGNKKGIRPVKNWVVGYWRGYLSGARCRLAHGPADATATHCLLLQWNPDWFYLSGTSSPR